MTQWQTVPENVEVIHLTEDCLLYYPVLWRKSISGQGKKIFVKDSTGAFRSFKAGDYLVRFSDGRLVGYSPESFQEHFREERE